MISHNSQPDGFTVPYKDSPTSEYIHLPQARLSIKDAHVYARALIECLSCNVATPTFSSDTFSEGFVIELDLKTFTDFQKLGGDSTSLEITLVKLLEYYGGQTSVTIILLSDVLESRSSYAKFTAQLAHNLRLAQKIFQFIRVKFDHLTSRLIISASKESFSLKKDFIHLLAESLKVNLSLLVPFESLPKTYQTNRAMLKLRLKPLMPEFEITVRPQTDGLKIEAKNLLPTPKKSN